MQAAGYLSELALVTALALFVRLTGENAAAAKTELKPYLRAPYGSALAACGPDDQTAWERVRAVDLDEWR